MIEVLSSGAPNLIQDLGRVGYLDIGVGRSGAMDAMALSLANTLVGNNESDAGMEISLFPFRLRFQRDTVFACTGTDGRVLLDDQPQSPWWGRLAKAGQTLTIERPRRSTRAYLAFAGGIDVAPVMGARATDLKSGFGGKEGRGLKRGDVISLLEKGEPKLKTSGLGLIPRELPGFWNELSTGCIQVRAIAAAEYHRFTQAAQHAFTSTEFKITPDANRQGYRLNGEMLALSEPLELFSHGIVPGTIQVPPSGQPIIQLAEANTCGGYPKIATVAEVDLWRLAQAPIGCGVRFVLVSQEEALAAFQEQVRERESLGIALEMMKERS